MSNFKIEKSFGGQPSQSGLKKLLKLLEDAQNFTNKGLHTLHLEDLEKNREEQKQTIVRNGSLKLNSNP